MNDYDRRAVAADAIDHEQGEEDHVAASGSVDAVVSDYLDYLEGHGQPPVLDELTAEDRRHAEALIEAMRAGRGLDPHASTPSVEELLAGTELESALMTLSAARPNPFGTSGGGSAPGRRAGVVDHRRARVERIESKLCGADRRVVVRIEPHRLLGPAVAVAYLDLRVVFFPIEGDEPVITDETRALVGGMFDADANLDHVGVVADSSNELLTQVLSCSDLGPALITSSDRLELLWQPVLPLPLALRRLLELAAPVWEPYVFDSGLREPLDLSGVADRVTRNILAREVTRPYRGQKARAYKSFAGAQAAFAGLVAMLGTEAAEAPDIDALLDRVMRDAA